MVKIITTMSSMCNNCEKYLKYETNQIESTDVSNFGFGRRPERRTINSKDHISKLFSIMIIQIGNMRSSKRIRSVILRKVTKM